MQHGDDAHDNYDKFEESHAHREYTNLHQGQSPASAQRGQAFLPAGALGHQQQAASQSRVGKINDTGLKQPAIAPIGSPLGLHINSSSSRGTHSPSNNARFIPVQQPQGETQGGFDRGFSGGAIFLHQTNQFQQNAAGRSNPDRVSGLQLPTPESPMNFQPFAAYNLQNVNYDRFKDGFGGFFTPQTHHQGLTDLKADMSVKSTAAYTKQVNTTAGFSAFAEKVKRRRNNSEEEDAFASQT